MILSETMSRYWYLVYLILISFSFSFCLQYEYFNAVLINEVDEVGNSVELGGEFILQPNDHFNNLSVNLSLSVVQVPTNMYNKGMFATGDLQWSCQKDLYHIPSRTAISLNYSMNWIRAWQCVWYSLYYYWNTSSVHDNRLQKECVSV